MPDRMTLLVARPTPAGLDRRALVDLAVEVAQRSSGRVAVAHLDQAEPSVHTLLDEAHAAGVALVVVVPLAVPGDGYLRIWLARAVANWRETRGTDRPEVRVTADPATSTGLADLVATLALGETEPITASPAAFRSPAWSVIDPHDRHLLICRGPRCTAYGAGGVHRALAAAVRGTPALVTSTGCLGPCNLGPLVVEHPPGTWHERVDPACAAEIVGED